MKRGMYIGRFQPFHLGHLTVIERALKEVDFLYIAIGSSQESHTRQNPFHAGERTKMIQFALNTAQIEPSRYAIIPIPDIGSDPQWPAHVRSYAPNFTKVYTRTEDVKGPFEKYDDAEIIWVKEVIPVTASQIRKKIRLGQEWESDVPPSVAEFIKTQGGLDRINHPKTPNNPNIQ